MKREDLLQIDVHPFTQLIWNSAEHRRKWEDLVRRASRVHDRAEYWMVKDKQRPCGTLHIYPANYDREFERLQQDGVYWLPIQRTRNYDGFSHKHFPVDHLEADCNVYGVISTSLEDAEDFRAASGDQDKKRMADHKAIATLLGFPECCADFFVDCWPLFFDPVWQSAVAGEHRVISDRVIEVVPHISTHQMLRYSGFRVTSHFPCSLDCEESIRVGEKWLETMAKYDPEGTEALVEILKLPGKWSCKYGVAVVETEPFTIVTNSLPTRERWEIRWEKVLG